MKSIKLFTTKETERITKENVKFIGELIAISALKRMKYCSNNVLDKLYLGLLKDINQEKSLEDKFTDGYDIAMTAICFLCEYIGQPLGAQLRLDKHGKPTDIKSACYREVYHYIEKQRLDIYNNYSLEYLLPYEEPFINFEYEETTNEESEFDIDKVVEELKLSQGQKDVLYCYYNGMTYVKIARLLSVHVSTVWSRRMRIQKKYNKLKHINLIKQH